MPLRRDLLWLPFALVVLVCAVNFVWGAWGIWQGETEIRPGLGRGGPRVQLTGSEALAFSAARIVFALAAALAAPIVFSQLRRDDIPWPKISTNAHPTAHPQVPVMATVVAVAVAAGFFLIGAWKIAHQSARVAVGSYASYHAVSGAEAVLYGVTDLADGVFWGSVASVFLQASPISAIRVRVVACAVAAALLVWCSATFWIAFFRFGRGSEHIRFAGYQDGAMAWASILGDLLWATAWVLAAAALFRFARDPRDGSLSARLFVAAVPAAASIAVAILLVLVGLVRGAFFWQFPARRTARTELAMG